MNEGVGTALVRIPTPFFELQPDPDASTRPAVPHVHSPGLPDVTGCDEVAH